MTELTNREKLAYLMGIFYKDVTNGTYDIETLGRAVITLSKKLGVEKDKDLITEATEFGALIHKVVFEGV